MKMYFAGGWGGTARSNYLIEKKANRLFSYWALIDKESGWGEEDRFREFLEWKEENENHEK